MAVVIRSLVKTVLPTTESDVYTVAVNKAVIVKSIRLVNTGTGAATVNMYARRATGGTNYRILPKDLSIAPGAAFVDGTELTLEGLAAANGEDRIRAVVNTGATVDCIISGVERDQA